MRTSPLASTDVEDVRSLVAAPRHKGGARHCRSAGWQQVRPAIRKSESNSTTWWRKESDHYKAIQWLGSAVPCHRKEKLLHFVPVAPCPAARCSRRDR